MFISMNRQSIDLDDCYQYAEAFELSFFKIVAARAYNKSHDTVTVDDYTKLPDDVVHFYLSQIVKKIPYTEFGLYEASARIAEMCNELKMSRVDTDACWREARAMHSGIDTARDQMISYQQQRSAS